MCIPECLIEYKNNNINTYDRLKWKVFVNRNDAESFTG
jgi:hypothetical protein